VLEIVQGILLLKSFFKKGGEMSYFLWGIAIIVYLIIGAVLEGLNMAGGTLSAGVKIAH